MQFRLDTLSFCNSIPNFAAEDPPVFVNILNYVNGLLKEAEFSSFYVTGSVFIKLVQKQKG